MKAKNLIIYKQAESVACDIIFTSEVQHVHGGSETVTFKTGFGLNSAASILCNIMSVRYSKNYSIMSYTRIVTERGVKDMCKRRGGKMSRKVTIFD